MKNFLRNHKLAAPSIAALVVVSLTVANVLAAPTATPTGGNVDANFDSMNVGSPTGLTIDSTGSLSNPVPGAAVGVTDDFGLTGAVINQSGTALQIQSDSGVAIANTAGAVGLNIAANGDISNVAANTPVNISDPDGIKSFATAGFGSIGGDFQGVFGGVRASSSGIGSVGGAFTGPVGVNGTSTGVGSGSGGIFFGQGFGVLGSSTSTGIGGRFSNSAAGAPIVNLSSSTYALGLTPIAGGSNLFQINNTGVMSNPGPNTGANNYGEVTITDPQGMTVNSTTGDAIEAYADSGLAFYGTSNTGDGMYIGAYDDYATAITGDASYPNSTVFYASGGGNGDASRAFAGQADIGLDVMGDTIGAVIGSQSDGNAVMGRSVWSSPGGTWPGGGIGGFFEAYKGLGLHGESQAGGQAGRFYYRTCSDSSAPCAITYNRVDIATPTKSLRTEGDVDFRASVFNSATTPGVGGRPPTDNPLYINDGMTVNGGISADGIGAPFGSFNDLNANTSLRVSHIWPVGFDVDTRFENGGIIVSNVAGGGGPTNASITKTGHMTAVQGYGTIYRKIGSSAGTIAASGFGSAGTVSCNSTNDRVVECGIDYSSSGWVVESEHVDTGNKYSCNPYAYNPRATSQIANSFITCFDPDAPTW